MRFLYFQYIIELVEGVHGSRLEPLEVEERHGGIEHLNIVGLDELLTDFECVVFLAFWGFEIHGAHE